MGCVQCGDGSSSDVAVVMQLCLPASTTRSVGSNREINNIIQCVVCAYTCMQYAVITSQVYTLFNMSSTVVVCIT
jgi:hypothetical protein